MTMNNHVIEITDLNMSELDIFARLTDSQLLHYYEPDFGLFIAETNNVILRALRDGYKAEALIIDKRWLKEAEAVNGGSGLIPNSGEVADVLAFCGDVPIYTADAAALKNLLNCNLTDGIACAMRRRKLPSIEEVCAGARRIVVLEKVMNPINVGSIFRSAAALHMDAVLLTAGCADPLYRRSSRVGVGTVFQIPWTYLDIVTEEMQCSRQEGGSAAASAGQKCRKPPVRPSAGDPGRYVPVLQKMGFRTAAFALTDDSVSIEDPCLAEEDKLAVIVGTEGDGLLQKTIEDCDYTVKIPMSHGVDSLNVAAASAVAFWQLTRK